jgi:hypothetical protein
MAKAPSAKAPIATAPKATAPTFRLASLIDFRSFTGMLMVSVSFADLVYASLVVPGVKLNHF